MATPILDIPTEEAFFRERIEIWAYGCAITTEEIYDRYLKFCEEYMDYRPLNKLQLIKQMKLILPQAMHTWRYENGTQRRAWKCVIDTPRAMCMAPEHSKWTLDDMIAHKGEIVAWRNCLEGIGIDVTLLTTLKGVVDTVYEIRAIFKMSVAASIGNGAPNPFLPPKKMGVIEK